MGVVVRNGPPRSQNRHVVRKPATEANDAIPQPIEGRQTERVDSRELLAKLEQELNSPTRAKSPSDLEAMLEFESADAKTVVKPVSPARLAHTLRRPGAVQAPPPPRPPISAASTVPMTAMPAMPVEDDDVPISLAEGSGPLEPLTGTMSGPIPQSINEQTTEPSPAFEAVFDATKLAGPLARHGERLASRDTKSPPLRPRDVVLGIMLGLGIVGGAWLTLMALL